MNMPIKVNNKSTIENPVGRFMVAVGAVIANQDGKVLLIKRSNNLDWHPGEWEIMYGRIAQHEDPRDGLKRELMEELGITVTVGQPLTCWHIYRGHEEIAENELVGITFSATSSDLDVKLSDEHEEYRWVTPAEALELIKVEGIKRDIIAFANFQGVTLQYMSHLSHDELAKKLIDAAKLVKIGGIYKHYKYPERNYKVTNLAIQEASEKVCVIYQDVSDKSAPSFVRDLDSWLEKVEWHGSIVDRFKIVHT